MDAFLPSTISCLGSIIGAFIAAAATIVVARMNTAAQLEKAKGGSAGSKDLGGGGASVDEKKGSSPNEIRSSRVWGIASVLIGITLSCVTILSPAVLLPILAIVFGVVGIFSQKNWAGITGITLSGISIFIASVFWVSNIWTQYDVPAPTSIPSLAATTIPSPMSTLTDVPTAVPTLTVKEQAENLLALASQTWDRKIFDTFDQNSFDWPVGEKPTSDNLDVANVTINGKYYVDIQTADGGGWWLLSEIQAPRKFYYKVDARRTTVQSGCIMSLTWSTPNGHYLYEIYDQEKNYRLEVYDREISENDGWRDVIPKTTTNLILAQDVNRLAVINDETYLWLYINDQFVDRAENEYTASGDLGFYVSVCNDNSQVTFEFDNLELRTP